MWKGRMFILWNHIADIFYEDRECGPHLLPKITYEHIKSTSYSIMNVKLAAQVLSSTVSNVLSNYVSPDAAKTAKFCSLMDTFYDVMNIRDVNSHKFDLKPSLIPFSSIDNTRFSWLRNVFLQYVDECLHPMEHREGNFSRNAKNKVFISQETCEGLKISVNAIIKAVQFLLQHEIRYVLTERFSQDPLENYSVVNAAWVRERIILQYVTSDTMPTQFEIRRFFDQCLVMLGVLMKQTLSLRTNQKKQKNN